jgi:hypothetical protein
VQRLAAAVRIGPRPVLVPFTIDSLPATVDNASRCGSGSASYRDDGGVRGSSAPEADNNPWLTGIHDQSVERS